MLLRPMNLAEKCTLVAIIEMARAWAAMSSELSELVEKPAASDRVAARLSALASMNRDSRSVEVPPKLPCKAFEAVLMASSSPGLSSPLFEASSETVAIRTSRHACFAAELVDEPRASGASSQRNASSDNPAVCARLQSVLMASAEEPGAPGVKSWGPSSSVLNDFETSYLSVCDIFERRAKATRHFAKGSTSSRSWLLLCCAKSHHLFRIVKARCCRRRTISGEGCSGAPSSRVEMLGQSERIVWARDSSCRAAFGAPFGVLASFWRRLAGEDSLDSCRCSHEASMVGAFLSLAIMRNVYVWRFATIGSAGLVESMGPKCSSEARPSFSAATLCCIPGFLIAAAGSLLSA